MENTFVCPICILINWLPLYLYMDVGLDLMDMAGDIMNPGNDPSRRAHQLRKLILSLQESFLVIEKCPQPVIAAVHSGCVGGGVDMVCSCDIRLCSADAWFQVKVCFCLYVKFSISHT